jgi:hypothetical protein
MLRSPHSRVSLKIYAQEPLGHPGVKRLGGVMIHWNSRTGYF